MENKNLITYEKENNCLHSKYITVKIYIPSGYVFKLVIEFLELRTFNELLFKIYSHLKTLDIDNLSIILGQLFYIRRDIIDSISTEIPSEYSINITYTNFDCDFIENFENFENFVHYLEFKILDEKFYDINMQNISDKFIELFVDIEEFSLCSEDKMNPLCLKNNIAFLKSSYDFLKEIIIRMNDIAVEYHKCNDENLSYLYNVTKVSLRNFHEKCRNLESYLKSTSCSRKLIEKIINTPSIKLNINL